MKLLLSIAALGIAILPLAVPAGAAPADRIPDTVLRESNQSCLSRCTESRSYAACAEVCACMVGEMNRHWTRAEYQARIDRMTNDPRDPQTAGEMTRIADHCAQRTPRPASR